MGKINSDRLKTLLAEGTVHELAQRARYEREPAELLEEARELVTDPDPTVRRQAWDALDLVVDDSTRADLFALVLRDLEPEQFRRLLTDPDPVVRNRAGWVNIVVVGYPSRHTTALELLADDRFEYAWPECIEVLRRDPPVKTLVSEYIEAPPDLRKRLSVALGLPAATPLLEVSPEGCSTQVHCWPFTWCSGVVAARECPHLPLSIALLGSSLHAVRDEAMNIVEGFGPGATDLLRSARRSLPAARRNALLLLAGFGWDHIPAEDRRALQRLIRIKQVSETPEPLPVLDAHGGWYAFPTTDQAAVLDALDLTDPVPATLRMGSAVMERSSYYPDQPNPEVFVTPALDGWTVAYCKNEVLGGLAPRAVSTEHRHDLYQRLEELSRRFGSAHWYEHFGVDDYTFLTWSQWCIAREGEIRMHCVSSDDVWVYRCEESNPVDSLGELKAWIEAHDIGRANRRDDEERAEAYEDVLGERHGDDRLPDEHDAAEESDEDGRPTAATWEQNLLFGAWAAAEHLSVDLTDLGPHTHVHGTAVLAVPRTQRDHHRRGVLPI
ncbi:hypothetical protein [Amycolatopsis viridis]|uniref:HEAT repeat domain-containing protein n=1 Tax=Amycolatopsis viridis TaxID=185678 RepID=A0ABX0STQ9_9PSEU|nr:hypothetical protein [Amycolatopsis viridis]NIH80337.1 hypothetical protein [Amycolatopsis viridis]